jgi:predicted RNA-binding Zn ribbon-like protein
MDSSTSMAAEPAEILLIADDLALDFVNSRYGVDTARRECLTSDERVLEWLQRAGVTGAQKATPTGRRGALLSAALELRESTFDLLEKRKAGSLGNPAVINRILALGKSYEQLVWKKARLPELHQHRELPVIEAVLVPIAEAAGRLLAAGDFELVRKCESAGCTLWFYDRTKSHHRRWCSMALCGNRAKVAAYRARRKD